MQYMVARLGVRGAEEFEVAGNHFAFGRTGICGKLVLFLESASGSYSLMSWHLGMLLKKQVIGGAGRKDSRLRLGALHAPAVVGDRYGARPCERVDIGGGLS